ncbi:Sterile alpha motif domain-containing protein 9-like [Channa argus]|uniref:Sterile alpha motif domain-containing protein 9-like n=1 Tax=Channa argus TaxID=215402 RepID=A0A6G1Q640_CHAAH|nr:Sterile alpha motif domain-containing protein 9-like [Channa argus]KAK2899987.1 hypothetical protein Q8A73_013116 [Channa argus]
MLITMETLTEYVAPDIRDETFEDIYNENVLSLILYLQRNPRSTNTELFSYLALLKTYLPESYLLMSDCQQILGPPDPIHGGPPFEVRMRPFIALISTSNPRPGHVCLSNQEIALNVVQLLHHLKISRSATVKKLMSSLCGNQPKPYIIQYIKDLLTKREMRQKYLNKFSSLITDIMMEENFYHAVSVLKTASEKFRQNPTFPQNLSRLYYIKGKPHEQKSKAEYWANKAIERAPNNSYVADTLGQIYKNCLRRARQPEDVRAMTEEAFKAFKDVEEKAEKEEGPELEDVGPISISKHFNNRGLFGFIQVAKIAFEKMGVVKNQGLIQNKKMEVEEKFDFFEWYLIYSKPDVTILEPHYFWKDVALCYHYYTDKTASESTSFPGLLDCLNQGLFLSKGRRAEFEEVEKTVSDLEEIQDVLKKTYEENTDDVKVAERYILSNIILSNKMPDSPRVTSVTELKTIIHRFLNTKVGQRSPEFYLLVLLLFWPEEQTQILQKDDNEEVEQQATHNSASEDETSEDEDTNEEQETEHQAAQLPSNLMFDPDLEQNITFMEKAFERTQYAKYLRGRYLLPLFFLGKRSGLSKWIHKSKLDAIVEKNVDTELAGESYINNKNKLERINEIWENGEVWQIQEIKDILLPLAKEQCHILTTPQEHNEQVSFVYAGGKKVKAFTEVESDALAQSSMLFYLGFTIRCPVVFSEISPV